MTTILCIDDSKDDVFLLRHWLGPDFSVTWAQGNQILLHNSFDLVLVDRELLRDCPDVLSAPLPLLLWSGLQINSAVWMLDREGLACHRDGCRIQFADRSVRFICKDDARDCIAAVIMGEINKKPQTP